MGLLVKAEDELLQLQRFVAGTRMLPDLDPIMFRDGNPLAVGESRVCRAECRRL